MIDYLYILFIELYCITMIFLYLILINSSKFHIYKRIKILNLNKTTRKCFVIYSLTYSRSHILPSSTYVSLH